MRTKWDIIKSPVITEKALSAKEISTEAGQQQLTFRVDVHATKPEIKSAVESIFNVKVDSVHTMNRQGKSRRTRFGVGKRKDTKRAIVSLAEGHRIDIFGGPVS